MKTTMSLAAAMGTLAAGSAHAGLWASSTWTDDSDLPLSSSLTYTHAIDFAEGTPENDQAATTIAGVSFTEEYVSDGGFNNSNSFSGTHIPTANAWTLTYTITSGNGAFGWKAAAASGPSGTESTTLSTALTGHGGTATHTADYSLVLSGLTTNTDYIFTFYNANFDFGGTTRQVILDGADDGVGNTQTAVSTSNDIYRYAYNTGASTTFTLNGASTGSAISAFTNEAVPEPSTTALLGLGGLALILRRRK